MNLFKKKYKRSEWFDGVLEAERLLGNYKTGENLFVVDTDGMDGYDLLWRNYQHEKPWRYSTVSREFGQGVIDYLENILQRA